MVTLHIDNITSSVPEGTSVLEAARRIGIWIPTLCSHEALTPFGGCRLCVVEAGRNGSFQVVASCTYRATNGLEVRTATDRVMKIRRFIVELLLAEAPQAAAVQDLARELGVIAPARFKPRNELCIACGLCIRACREIVGVSAIDFARRGYERVASSPFYERSDACIGCGTCAAVCPTGAISKRDIPAGEKAVLSDGSPIAGPARIIDNWKVSFALKNCAQCGEPFAPQFQLDYITNKAALPADFFEVCRQCRPQT
jgi:NADH dehydrogenase/NADH:ubiquinone oxidoreductase subunit G